MHTLQPNNETSDILAARNYTPLNDYEKDIVRDGIQTSHPRESIARSWLCPYHPEIVRALSLNHRELLRLLERDAQIPLPATTPILFDEVIW